MKDYHIRPDCRLCGGGYILILDLGETALANEVWEDPSKPQDKFPLQLVQCDECRHVQNPVVVDPERLFRHYSYTSGLTESYRQHLKGYAEQVDAYLDTPGDLLVEIGGNDGTLGSFWEADRSVNYVNIDPSDVPQEHGKRIIEFFSKEVALRTRALYGPAKVIVANHVFAHADDLHDMAEGVGELLADDGVFFCEVGHGPTQLNSGCLDVIYHEHTDYHSLGPLWTFFSRHGLLMKRAELVNAQGTSMRLQLVKEGAYDSSFIVDGTWIGFGIPRIQAAAKHLRGLGQVLDRLDDDLELGVYGAPAKLTTLLALTGVENPFRVFDDSPRKVGKYVPGHHASKIDSPSLEALNRFDFMLIASWNFADEIIKRWPGYKGTWIVPLPEVRFIPGGGA